LLNKPGFRDLYVEWRALWSVPGRAGWPDLSADQWAVAIRGICLSVANDHLAKVYAYGPTVSDDLMWQNLYNVDDGIGSSINNIHMQTNAGEATGKFYEMLDKYIRVEMSDPDSIYSCYAGYNRANHDVP